MLYLVPTPIGNLKDFTFRAVEVLQQVDFILCEDTRTSSKLLQHYNIQKPLTPYHQHNEHKVVEHLVSQLIVGKNIALITDAGSPGISDPAFFLVRRLLIRQGPHRRLSWKSAQSTWFIRCYAETGPLSKRGSWHHEPLPARRSVCDGRRG